MLNNPLAYVDENGKWPTDIHNRIIDLVFRGLSNKSRKILKDASWEMDNPRRGGFDQKLVHRHGLRRKDQNIDDAARDAREWIHENQRKARNAMTTQEQLKFFGYALHTVLDMTSPAHEGYQVWTELGSMNPVRFGRQIGDVIGHLFAESLMDLNRQGLAVGAAIRLAQDTFGEAHANAVVGYEPGSKNDPNMREIDNRCSITGCTGAQLGEMKYLYLRGVSRGLNFNWEDTRASRPQGIRR